MAHIIEALDDLDAIAEEANFQDYVEHRRLQRQSERCIEVISEASKHLPSEWKDNYPEIEWRSVRDIGNVIRHAYDGIDHSVMWAVVTKRAKELRPVIEDMTKNLDPEDGNP